MSLPPQILRIKRKRDDDPVESLYIQTESDNSQHKRQYTEHHHVFRRLHEEATRAPVVTSYRPKSNAKTSNRKDRPWRMVKDSSDNGANLSTVVPRRFHLSKLKNMVKQSPVLGKRKDHNAELVTFVEEREAKKQQTAYDKPDNPKILAPPSLDLQQAMERYAIEQAGSSDRIRHECKDVVMENSAMNSHGEDDDAMDIVDDPNYVYDTYVRHDMTNAPLTSNVSELGDSDVGYLIISKEDDYFWQDYGSDEDGSEKDWNSDQDDENAENYYGADYPEEEVDSEDEYDKDPYQYRVNAASDDGEYGSDLDVWSGDDESHDLEGWTKAH